MPPRRWTFTASNLWVASLIFLTASPAYALSAAVLPNSRSVQVGQTATVFATVINTTFTPVTGLTGCRIALATAIPATFAFQTTNPSTNTVTGTPNTPVNLTRGARQTFILSITPTAPMLPTVVEFRFFCDTGPDAPTAPGLNTVLLSASTTPVADVIATVLPTGSFNPALLVADPNTHEASFAVSAFNAGITDLITVSADTGTADLPVTLTLCQTTIATAGCLTPAGPSVSIPMAAGAGVGLAVFVQATGGIQSDPAANRIFVRFKDSSGATRGSTSIALVAPGFPPPPSDIIDLRAFLDGAQEVPPTSSSGAGSVVFRYDQSVRELRFNIFLSSLVGTQTAAQIRGPAAPGVNAPVVFTLPLGNTSGTLPLTPAQEADLLAGLWYVNVLTTAFPEGEIRGQILRFRLISAVLPGSRSVAVGTPATAFATIRNLGPEDATGCRIALATSIPAALTYQTTDPATNTVTGAPNTPVDMGSFTSQTFVIAITPNGPIPPTEVGFRFECETGQPATTVTGVNTLLLSASVTPTADVVAIALLPAGASTLFVDPTSHQGAFALAAVNVGASATTTLTADTGALALPVTITLCQTTPTGVCQSPPASSVTLGMPTGSGAGFAVFVTGTGSITANASVNRLFLRFKDAGGATRGSTSVAVTAP
jgi:hypothetical protein